MFNLFYMGGPLFMSILTLILIAVIILFIGAWLRKTTGELIKEAGLLGLVIGILGQLIGLFSAFQGIETMGNVSPAMLAGGLKVSMITTVYGMLIYIIALILWFVVKARSVNESGE